ncbi:hypothetical protein KAR91_32540 [Candidatus Pacearchaeota archaeon]|nr:hypothetical protein [Candidatus Pacearchaeota archaeon]
MSNKSRQVFVKYFKYVKVLEEKKKLIFANKVIWRQLRESKTKEDSLVKFFLRYAVCLPDCHTRVAFWWRWWKGCNCGQESLRQSLTECDKERK